MASYIEVHIACPSEEEGSLIAKQLIERHLAAAVQMVPIRSFYYWENILNEDSEVLLIAKTKYSLFQSRIIPAVKALHSYEITEIVAIPVVDGDPEFLKWVDQQLAEQ